MNSYTSALIFLVLALAGIVVRKTYFALPLRELKRRAAKHQKPYDQLYRAAAYGSSLRTLLWLYIGLTSAASLILLARALPVWVSLLLVGPLLWIAFSLIPATQTTRLGTSLTVLVTPAFTWLLNYLHPSLSRGVSLVQKRTSRAHTGIFERDDLIDLINRQQNQSDNRLTAEELEILKRVLQFDDKCVGDIMTPRDSIKTVLTDDTIGPILIDELHQSGQAFALVRASRKGDFVGSLAFQELNLDSSGQVKNSMDSTIYYLHEADKLGQALHAFFTTNRPLFVVVNSAGEFVGMLTITGVLRQLLGHVPGEEFDQYADKAAVAARRQDGKPTESQETPVKTDDKVVE